MALGVDEEVNSGVIWVMYCVICAVGITGNLLVCIVLLRVPSLRSNTSHFLIHLSVVDLLVCILVIPFKIVLPRGQPDPGFWGQVRCRLYVGQFAFWILAMASVFGLVAVNMERFVAIVYPHMYKRIFARNRNQLLAILACWILATLLQTFALFLYDEDREAGCQFLGWPTPAIQASFGVFTFTVSLLLPFVLMVGTQLKVISTLKAQVETLNRGNASRGVNRAAQREMWQLRTTQTLVKTLLAFALTFAACWAPNQTIFLLFNLGVVVKPPSALYHASIILAVGNSCVNPIIYTLTNKPFRRGIMGAFQRRIQPEPVGVKT